jgi:nucleoside-diphosphate-sugar epimerase
MKNLLLIGGAGYVGTVLTAHLLKKGHRVTVLDSFIYGNEFSVVPYVGDPGFRLVRGDLRDPSKLSDASAGITDVILLAGLVGDPITKKYPSQSEDINDKGIKSCIDFFDNKEIDKLIFISTCSNYGLIKENEMADEKFELNPLSLYAKAKVSNEKYLQGKKCKVGYQGVILRFATAFGLSPRMRFDLTISEFTRDICSGKDLLVFDENTWRPYCHVRDFAQLLETIISSNSKDLNFEVFNAGGDRNNFTKKMIVDEILKRIPGGKVSYGTQGSDPRNYRVSFNKIKQVLGFEPAFSVQQGIEELISALENGLYNDCNNSKLKYGNYEIQ